MSFDAIVLLTIWVKVLQSIDDRNVILQSGKMSIEVEAGNVAALRDEMQTLRNGWDAILSEASMVAKEMEVFQEIFKKELSRERRRKRMKLVMEQVRRIGQKQHSVTLCFSLPWTRS